MIRLISKEINMKNFCTSKNFDVVMIRHALSQFNEGIQDLQWEQRIKFKAYTDGVIYNEKYIDCKLTQKGKQQCIKTRDVLKNIPIDLILVSPHLRTLETCQLLFGSKPSIPVLVKSILAEACRFSCDAIDQLSYKKDRFPHYNFQEVEKFEQDSLVYNISEDKINLMKDYYKKNKIFQYKQKRKQLMKLMEQKIIYEEDDELRERGWQIKKMIQNYRKQYQKIAIVSHWYMLTVVRSRKFGEDGKNLQYDEVENCVPYFANINDLLKIH